MHLSYFAPSGSIDLQISGYNLFVFLKGLSYRRFNPTTLSRLLLVNSGVNFFIHRIIQLYELNLYAFNLSITVFLRVKITNRQFTVLNA